MVDFEPSQGARGNMTGSRRPRGQGAGAGGLGHRCGPPWQHAQRLVASLTSGDVVLTLVKDGDHRLSRPQDLDRLSACCTELAGHSRLQPVARD